MKNFYDILFLGEFMKKHIKILFTFLIGFSISINNVKAADLEIEPITFCEENNVLLTFQIIGYVLFIAKIIIPLLLIILGTIDCAKAAISSNDKANQEALSSLIRRIIAAVIIFLIPTIVSFVLSLIDGVSEFENNSWTNCTNCLLHPFDDSCESKGLFNDDRD